MTSYSHTIQLNDYQIDVVIRALALYRKQGALQHLVDEVLAKIEQSIATTIQNEVFDEQEPPPEEERHW